MFKGSMPSLHICGGIRPCNYIPNDTKSRRDQKFPYPHIQVQPRYILWTKT